MSAVTISHNAATTKSAQVATSFPLLLAAIAMLTMRTYHCGGAKCTPGSEVYSPKGSKESTVQAGQPHGVKHHCAPRPVEEAAQAP